MVTFGLRQQVDDQLTLMGGVEWANWSRFKELRYRARYGAVLRYHRHNLTGKTAGMFSLGAEYAYSDELHLRGGVAYEKSPVQMPPVRRVRPTMTAIGCRWVRAITFRKACSQIAYSHVFMKDGKVAGPNTTVQATPRHRVRGPDPRLVDSGGGFRCACVQFHFRHVFGLAADDDDAWSINAWQVSVEAFNCDWATTAA